MPARGKRDGALLVEGHDQVLHGAQQANQEVPLVQGLEFQDLNFGQVLDQTQDAGGAAGCNPVPGQGEAGRLRIRLGSERTVNRAAGGLFWIVQKIKPMLFVFLELILGKDVMQQLAFEALSPPTKEEKVGLTRTILPSPSNRATPVGRISSRSALISRG